MAKSVDVASALRFVRTRISELLVESMLPRDPRLVAVSKTQPPEVVMEAYRAGQRVFGENYVQELVDKAAVMPADVEWHFIGHLQTNKVKQLLTVPNLAMVETVDSAKLATKLDKECGRIGRDVLRVMVQVNTSGEDSKSGVAPEQCLSLVEHVALACPRLRFCGLMTIGELGDVSTKYFEVLADLRRQVVASGLPGLPEVVELSMGMSADYEPAIMCGSTSVRVGSVIFGERAYSASRPVESASDAPAATHVMDAH